MRATSSVAQTGLVGEVVELSASAPAISGDYVRADGQILSKSDFPLIATTPDVVVEGYSIHEIAGTPGGGPGSYLGVGQSLATTPDGSFISIGCAPDNTVSAYTYSLWKSQDGTAWKQVKYWESSATEDHLRVSVVNGILFLCSRVKGLMKSLDNGDTWTTVSDMACYSIAYGNGKYIVCNGTNVGYSSPDLVTWTKFTYYTGQSVYAVFYVGAKFFGVTGNASATCNSTDGTTWALVTLPVTHTTAAAKIVNGAVILFRNVNGSAAFIFSTDGISFTASTSTATNGTYVADCVFDGANYVFSVKGETGTYFLAKASTLSAAFAYITVSSAFAGNSEANSIGYAANKCLVLCYSYNYEIFSYFDTTFPSATVNAVTSPYVFPIPGLGVIKETLSGKRYSAVRQRVPGSLTPIGILLDDGAGYLKPAKFTDNTYVWASAFGSSDSATMTACYDLVAALWTMIIGHSSAGNWAYRSSIHNGIACLEINSIATLTASVTSEHETNYGLLLISAETTAVSRFVAKNQVSFVSTSGLTDGTTAPGFISSSYDGTVVISGFQTSPFHVSISYDGGRTWPVRKETPVFVNSSGANVTAAANRLVYVAGKIYASNGGELFVSDGKSLTFTQAPSSNAYSITNNGCVCEYEAGRVIGPGHAASLNGGKYTKLQSNLNSYGLNFFVAKPYVVDGWMIFACNKEVSSNIKYTYRKELPYSPAIKFRGPAIQPVNAGKNFYVKGR